MSTMETVIEISSPLDNSYYRRTRTRTRTLTISTNASGRTPTKREKILTLLAFALLYFTSNASYSVIAPFFPTKALEKGASGEVVGLIFGIFALVTCIFSPITGSLMPTLGVRFSLFSGMFVIGVTEFLFGFLNKMPDGDVFIAFAFVLRGFDGLGGAAAMTAAVVILAQCFPDNVASIMGGLELFSGLGLTLGPFIGGILYEYGGFGLPFFVLSAVILVTLPFIMFLLPPIRQESLSNGRPARGVTIMKVMKIPAFVIIVNTVILGGMAIGIVEPTLAPHLKDKFDVTSSTKIGLIFLLFCGCYALFAPLFGWLADKTSSRWVMCLGCFMCGIGFLLLGPAPLSFLPNKVWFVTFSMGLIGLAIGPSFVPAFAEMLNIVKAKGYPDNLVTHGVISGIFGAAYNVGAFLGPTLGGVITEYVKFNWTCTGFGILLIIQSLFLLGLTISGCSEKVANKTIVSENPTDENPSEITPLLSTQNHTPPTVQTC